MLTSKAENDFKRQRENIGKEAFRFSGASLITYKTGGRGIIRFN